MPIALPAGIFPVMLTPFHDDGAIDWGGLDALVDWHIDSGVAGLFAVCQSSEMYRLTPQERLDVAARVVARAAGRVPVVASGTFGGPLEAQAREVLAMAATGVNAVVVLTCQLVAQQDPAEAWIANASRLLDLTGDVPLGLYECPEPYKRLLSPVEMAWAAASGRMRFHKDTSCMMGPITAKIEAVAGTGFRFYNANTASLLASLRAGADGFSGIAANFFPRLYVWLCSHFAQEPQKAARVQRLLSAVQCTVNRLYPLSAKAFLGMAGLPIGPTCRVTVEQPNEEDLRILEHLLGFMDEMCADLGVGPISGQGR
ncbi:MAG: dihydrodipicolinate synthase family protein [Anaerolineae bacterium]